MDPRLIPRNSASEYNYGEQSGDASPNEAGIYYHPQADKFVETTGVNRSNGEFVYDRSSGKIQADAFVQLGYRLATEDEVKRYKKSLNNPVVEEVKENPEVEALKKELEKAKSEIDGLKNTKDQPKTIKTNTKKPTEDSASQGEETK